MGPDSFFQEALTSLASLGLLRDPDDGNARGEARAAAVRRGLAFIDASSNDYLGLGRELVSRETLLNLGDSEAGAAASRLIHGTRTEHLALEAALAEWVRQPAALLFSSGYAANVGLLAALSTSRTVLVSDALNHASIIDGARLGRGEVRVVPHLDLDAVERALSTAGEATARWVVTESYFSMDGDGPDLRRLRAICDRYEAGLVVDEAHALGVFGSEGAGRLAETGVSADVLLGTFGKAVGLQGAFVAGSHLLRSFLWNRCRSLVFSTAPSPHLCRLALLHVKQVREAEIFGHGLPK